MRHWSLILAVVFLVGALPVAAQELVMTGKPHVFALVSQNRSGEFGTVTLTPYGAHTEIAIALVGTSDEDLQPVNIYAGSCAKLDPHPKYALNYAVGGLSRTMLPVQFSVLTSGVPLAINVHRSTSNVGLYVVCGELKL